MAAMKPSVRSRSIAPQRAPPANGRSGYDAYHDEQLTAFENFDPKGNLETKVQSMSEKGIRRLCEELLDLKKVSADEMRKSVYTNYTTFIRTSKEIAELEGEITAMSNLLQSQAALIRTLAESGASIPLGSSGGSLHRDYYKDEANLTEAVQRTQALPDTLDTLLAERKVDDALAMLDEGEGLVASFYSGNGGDGGLSEYVVRQLEEALSERRARLAAYLAEAVQQPTVRGTELRSAISALDRLGDGSRAHTLMLQSHEERLKSNMSALRQSGSSYGGAYTTAISQLVFSAIAQASRDSVTVFGQVPSYASELVLWASKITEMCASIITRNVLLSSAATGGLRAAIECVQIALGHCTLLEEQGLTLCPTLSKLVRPGVEQALRANLLIIMESVGSLALADKWTLDIPPQRGSTGTHSSRRGVSNLILSSSAHRLNLMVQDFVDDVAPLVSMQMGGAALDGLGEVFDQYIDMLIKALPGQELDEDERRKIRIAATEAEQLALLGNAAALADELVSLAASKLLPGGLEALGIEAKSSRTATLASRSPELKDLRRRLQKAGDKLKLYLCNEIIVGLCYDEYGSKLSATTYVQIADNPSWHNDPMPTAVFQSLFVKLSSIQQIAGDVLAGRERVTQLLLIRLTETFVIELSTNEQIWALLEDDPRSLGPFGLQQFLLDMEFLSLVAKNGGYLSRTVNQQISEQQERMKDAYMVSGADLDSALPDPEWLLDTVQDNLHKLVQTWNRYSGEVPQEVTSPTAQSVSSMRSEGMHYKGDGIYEDTDGYEGDSKIGGTLVIARGGIGLLGIWRMFQPLFALVIFRSSCLDENFIEV